MTTAVTISERAARRIGEIQPGRVDGQVQRPARQLADDQLAQLVDSGEVELAGQHEHGPGFPSRHRCVKRGHRTLSRVRDTGTKPLTRASTDPLQRSAPADIVAA